MEPPTERRGPDAPGTAVALDLDEVRAGVDATIAEALVRARQDVVARSPASADLVDEIGRLVAAGGKRLRPLLVVLGHVAGGGRIADALPTAAALELFHTFALVHDDVMDDDAERRGVAATHRRFAESVPGGASFGRSVAILVGDLAFALAVDLVLSTPLPADRVLAAARRLRPMSLATAAGQYLDLRGGAPPAEVAALKTGAYTIEAPLAIGAELAGASEDIVDALGAVARPAGVAFQLLDDVADGSALDGARDEAVRLLGLAIGALAEAPIDPGAASALETLLRRMRGDA